jgi:hypothetical protein
LEADVKSLVRRGAYSRHLKEGVRANAIVKVAYRKSVRLVQLNLQSSIQVSIVRHYVLEVFVNSAAIVRRSFVFKSRSSHATSMSFAIGIARLARLAYWWARSYKF